MAFAIQHTAIGNFPFWYFLESHRDLEGATRRAQNYALDHGGYVCVKDANGAIVFGTDPAALDLAILNGINRDFPRETARRRGGCI